LEEVDLSLNPGGVRIQPAPLGRNPRAQAREVNAIKDDGGVEDGPISKAGVMRKFSAMRKASAITKEKDPLPFGSRSFKKSAISAQITDFLMSAISLLLVRLGLSHSAFTGPCSQTHLVANGFGRLLTAIGTIRAEE